MINYEAKVQRSGNTSRGCQTKDLIEIHILNNLCTDNSPYLKRPHTGPIVPKNVP